MLGTHWSIGGSASTPTAIEINAAVDEARQKADEAAARHERLHAQLQDARAESAARRADVESALDALHRSGTAPSRPSLLVALAQGLGRAGRLGESLHIVEEALELSDRSEERMYQPELLRIKGELLLLRSERGAAAAAENHFRQALDWARQQGALSWELRAATSLALHTGTEWFP